jgi:hypothetical protein
MKLFEEVHAGKPPIGTSISSKQGIINLRESPLLKVVTELEVPSLWPYWPVNDIQNWNTDEKCDDEDEVNLIEDIRHVDFQGGLVVDQGVLGRDTYTIAGRSTIFSQNRKDGRVVMTYWCIGYHICLTHKRRPVRFGGKSSCLFTSPESTNCILFLLFSSESVVTIRGEPFKVCTKVEGRLSADRSESIYQLINLHADSIMPAMYIPFIYTLS